MYVVCRASCTIRLYDTDTCSPLDVDINIDGMEDPTDIVVCRDQRQLYVAERSRGLRVWRVSTDRRSYTKWLPTESSCVEDQCTPSVTSQDQCTLPVTSQDPYTLSVTSQDQCTLSVTSQHLLVTSLSTPALRRYRLTDRRLLRVDVPPYVRRLYHGVETSRGTFVVGHQGTSQSEYHKHAVSGCFHCCQHFSTVLCDEQ